MIPLVISGGNHDRVMATEAISDAVRFLGIPGTVRGEKRRGRGRGRRGGGMGWIRGLPHSIPYH